MENLYTCPSCGEGENLHYNYDYSKQHRPVREVLCKKCGQMFDGNMVVEELLTKPGFVERRMALGKANNNKQWDKIYEDYKGVSDLHDFVDWLKANYIAPEKIC